jgi:hypothetical protein
MGILGRRGERGSYTYQNVENNELPAVQGMIINSIAARPLRPYGSIL